jgi:hypothetical protein
MRIHTDTLRYADVWEAARGLDLYPEILTEHGSRKRDHAFELQLSGSSTRMAQSGEWKAATWDEWGALIGLLFKLDPNASMSYYEDAKEFHRLTCGRFREGVIPEDTHPQHRWIYDWEAKTTRCALCSARQNR